MAISHNLANISSGNQTQSISGLYAITPDIDDTVQLALQVEAALRGGTRLVQYRHKTAQNAHKLEQASELLKICHRYHAQLIINDDVNLCMAINADGVHLGASDLDIATARKTLGSDKIIGASCYNQLDLAKSAEAAGASYVAFGACFFSSTKTNAAQTSLGLFAQAKNALTLPIVAIGGITLSNAQSVIKAGADSIAVINALFAAPDITNAAKHYTELFL